MSQPERTQGGAKPSPAAAASMPGHNAVAEAGLAIPPPSSRTPADVQWNTKNLGLRLGSDFLSALTAGSLVAPLISIIDR